MLIMIAQESGDTYIEDINNELADEGGASADEASMLEALIALYVRACRIASEVLCLLQAAMRRRKCEGRALHEVAVTAMFLTEHPGDTPRRYLDHAAVESQKSAEKYQEHCQTLGYEPFTDEEMAAIQKNSDAANQKYGPAY